MSFLDFLCPALLWRRSGPSVRGPGSAVPGYRPCPGASASMLGKGDALQPGGRPCKMTPPYKLRELQVGRGHQVEGDLVMGVAFLSQKRALFSEVLKNGLKKIH